MTPAYRPHRMTEYQLKLTSGKVVRWTGSSGEDAARRYVASHPDEIVYAWRVYPRQGVLAGMPRQIIEAKR